MNSRPRRYAHRSCTDAGARTTRSHAATGPRFTFRDHVIDLREAAAEITARLPAWIESGLSPGAITWRDGAAPWPQQLETDRALVTDPDSIGIRILGTHEWAELQLVLYRGGWADLDTLADDEVITEGPRITTPQEFGNLLDSAVTRFLRLGAGRRPAS